jgi:hypothetical protein
MSRGALVLALVLVLVLVAAAAAVRKSAAKGPSVGPLITAAQSASSALVAANNSFASLVGGINTAFDAPFAASGQAVDDSGPEGLRAAVTDGVNDLRGQLVVYASEAAAGDQTIQAWAPGSQPASVLLAQAALISNNTANWRDAASAASSLAALLAQAAAAWSSAYTAAGQPMSAPTAAAVAGLSAAARSLGATATVWMQNVAEVVAAAGAVFDAVAANPPPLASATPAAPAAALPQPAAAGLPARLASMQSAASGLAAAAATCSQVANAALEAAKIMNDNDYLYGAVGLTSADAASSAARLSAYASASKNFAAAAQGWTTPPPADSAPGLASAAKLGALAAAADAQVVAAWAAWCSEALAAFGQEPWGIYFCALDQNATGAMTCSVSKAADGSLVASWSDVTQAVAILQAVAADLRACAPALASKSTAAYTAVARLLA